MLKKHKYGAKLVVLDPFLNKKAEILISAFLMLT